MIVGPEESVLAANNAVAYEMVRAEARIRAQLETLQLPEHAIQVALSTMGVGVLRALVTHSCGPFLQSFVDRYEISDERV